MMLFRMSTLSQSRPPILRALSTNAFSALKEAKERQVLKLPPPSEDAPIWGFFEKNSPAEKPDGSFEAVVHGRAYEAEELRMKSFEDLHKLHFVLLVEKTRLQNALERARKASISFPSPERLRLVRRSMARLQTVLTERQRARRGTRLEEEAEAGMPEDTDGLTLTERFEKDKLESRTVLLPKRRKEVEDMNEQELLWYKTRLRNTGGTLGGKTVRRSPGGASGGQKTKRQYARAKQFEREVFEFIQNVKNEKKAAAKKAAAN